MTINLGQTLIGKASFCSEPNGIQIIVVGTLIGLIIVVTGGIIVAIYLIASTMLTELSWAGLITGEIFNFLQLPLDFHTLGFLG